MQWVVQMTLTHAVIYSCYHKRHMVQKVKRLFPFLPGNALIRAVTRVTVHLKKKNEINYILKLRYDQPNLYKISLYLVIFNT